MTNTFTDKNLTNGVQYCYLVTSYYATCESGFSNILCATPNAGGQPDAGVTMMETGKWVTTGKGKTRITFFDITSVFSASDAVVIRAYVIDGASGLPLPNATVDVEIAGPEVVLLTTGLSDANGVAEAIWQTQAPNKKGVGGTLAGVYIAATINVTATGYSWDGGMTSTTFTIQ